MFHCTLQSAPTHSTQTNYLGITKTFQNARGDVAGGCIAISRSGLKWTCYAGKLAVRKHIIGADFLGQHQSAPAEG